MTGTVDRPWRTTALLTVAALAVLAAYDRLPRGGKLTHMDFLADDSTVLELCNPLNPAILPVATGSLPVTMTFSAPGLSGPAGLITAEFDLTTISGRPVTPEDLELVDGRRIRVNVSNAGVQEARPVPGRSGRWSIAFLPHGHGPFLVTADFIPASTGKPLEATANLHLATAAQP